MRRRELAQRIGLALLCATAVTAGCTFGMNRGWLNGPQGWARDAVFPRDKADDRVLVVGIDAPALDRLGRWPWSRTNVARLVDRLGEAGARTVVLDIVLDSPQPDDAQLVAAMGRVPTVLSWYPQALDYDPTLDVNTASPNVNVEPTPALRDAAVALGHTVVTPSRVDGITRRLPLVIDDSVTFRPALALAALAAATGVPTEQVILQPHAVQLGNRAVPTTDRHQLTINFATGFDDSKSPGYLSADEVIKDDRLDPATASRIANRVVLVGLADSNLGDYRFTPLEKSAGQPGVSVHANALNTILRDSYLTEPSRSATTVIVLLGTLTISLAVMLLGLRTGLVLTAAFILGVLVWSIGPAASSGKLIDVIWPWVGAAFAAAGSVALRYFVADRQRRRASDLFRQYVPASVSDELLASGLLDQQVQGVRVEVSTMFCDLRGFTAMTHELGPQVLRSILNHYYEYATAIVERHHGTLMQFVGDEVYAVFGAPLPSTDHQRRAVSCAVDLVSHVDELDRTLVAHGYRTIRFGVGVATGSAIAAHVGSSTRRQYTVVGDAVNLGARLCSQAKADQVVVSEPAADQAGIDALVRTNGALSITAEALELKGFDLPYPVRRVCLATATSATSRSSPAILGTTTAGAPTAGAT